MAKGQNAIAEPLLHWFDRAGRKHLPWQLDRTPYRVWISEIMLQQTQVATVIPYYERFMQRFPDVRALASAPNDEVLHLWTGLGYYARARNLHRAAQRIVETYNGEFPATIDEVESLPGIGRSTAGAILALSRCERHPILDGNVKRVLTRCFGVEGFSGEAAIEKRLWTLAEQCTPYARIDDYTQAIMDLGATVCVRSRPLCNACPLHAVCVARIEGRQTQLPTRRPKKTRPQRVAHVVIVKRDDGAVLLEQRPPMGIWGGLWMFPQFDDEGAARAWLASHIAPSPQPSPTRGEGARGIAAILSPSALAGEGARGTAALSSSALAGEEARGAGTTLSPSPLVDLHQDVLMPRSTGMRGSGREGRGEGADGARTRKLAPYAHAFTHFDLTLYPLLIEANESLFVCDDNRYRWYDAARPAKIGLAKPAVDLMRALHPKIQIQEAQASLL